ncbi:MAG: hypothetical protein M3539_13315, partial [Acidobacteriota bacterium]|nr:hypothetical protein [Acidobacteriota bacterium]
MSNPYKKVLRIAGDEGLFPRPLSSADKIEAVKVSTPKILVIDDDDQIRELLMEIFADRYDCWEVNSA